jgi:hypothetical protein
MRARTFLLAAVLALGPGCSSNGNGGDPGQPDAATTPNGNPEQCNGLDDNADGRVDEGCSCTLGSVQVCWPFSPDQRGRGICRDGQQHCYGNVEFTSWGPCEGYTAPTGEITGNGIDENCDGLDTGDECVPQASGEHCEGGVDEDCDGLIDCADPDCAWVPGCDQNPNQNCECIPGQYRWCDSPVQCMWGRQQCLPDGSWGTCVETDQRPPGCDGYYYDPWCCVAAGGCCQDPWQDQDIGECSQQIVCTDNPPPTT